MANLIYSDWMIGLLQHLGMRAPTENKYRFRQNIYTLVDLDDDAGKRAAGGKKLKRPGWPVQYFESIDGKPSKDNLFEHVSSALAKIGDYYGGPLLMAREAQAYLLGHGIVIEELDVAAGISKSRRKRSRPSLPERWDDCPRDGEEWEAFCGIFVKHCVRERSDSVKSDGLLTLPLALLTDTATRAERGNGTTIEYRPDSKGPVAHSLPKTGAGLLCSLLPERALANLGEEVGMSGQPNEELADQLLHGGNVDWCCSALSKYFISDGGNHYSLMIANAREILPPGHDSGLLRNRLSRLFREIKEKSPKPECVAQTWSEVQEHAAGDGARLLSGFVLCLILEPESFELLRVILRGRWG